jgi:hypothetical protein
VGLAATIVVGAFLYGQGVVMPARANAMATEAVAASLVRDQAVTTLVAGTELRQGDEIRVGQGGYAYLTVGRSHVRLAEGADLRLEKLDPDHIVLDQLAGRVYHRVAVADGGDYRVQTATVVWTATGTAFDIDRHAAPGGTGEEVVGLALQNGILVEGPTLQARLQEGVSATILLGVDGRPSGSPEIGLITADMLADAWLTENAYLDASLGLPLGELAALVSPGPSNSPSASAQATAQPTSGGSTAMSSPTHKATPKPTPNYTNLGALRYVRNGDGTYSFSWNAYKGPIAIEYYKVVGEPAGTNPDYTATGDYWACTDSSVTTSTVSISPGSWWIRVQAIYYTGGDGVGNPNNSGTVAHAAAWTSILKLTVTGSPTPEPTLPPMESLGNPEWDCTAPDGSCTLTWTAYSGGWDFDGYEVLYSASGTPSNVVAELSTDKTQWPAGSSPSPGNYMIEAVGCPYGTDYVFAETSVVGYP